MLLTQLHVDVNVLAVALAHEHVPEVKLQAPLRELHGLAQLVAMPVSCAFVEIKNMTSLKSASQQHEFMSSDPTRIPKVVLITTACCAALSALYCLRVYQRGNDDVACRTLGSIAQFEPADAKHVAFRLP